MLAILPYGKRFEVTARATQNIRDVILQDVKFANDVTVSVKTCTGGDEQRTPWNLTLRNFQTQPNAVVEDYAEEKCLA
jgi:hypothetical protein